MLGLWYLQVVRVETCRVVAFWHGTECAVCVEFAGVGGAGR